MEKRKKIGLALGSGGARGFCHIGVLQVFLENNIPIDYISGCSMGALVAACYSCGTSLEEMKEVALKIKQRTLMDPGRDTKGYNNNSGLLRGRKAMRIISQFLEGKNFEDTSIPLRITATNLCSGNLIVYDSGSIMQAVRASISIPAVFKAPYDGEQNLLVDGGILERIPINSVKALGADVVIAVDALGPPRDCFSTSGILSFADVIERSYLLLDWQSTQSKLELADFLITPEQGNRNIYIFRDNNYSIEQGRLAALEALPQILELIK